MSHDLHGGLEATARCDRRIGPVGSNCRTFRFVNEIPDPGSATLSLAIVLSYTLFFFSTHVIPPIRLREVLLFRSRDLFSLLGGIDGCVADQGRPRMLRLQLPRPLG